MSKEQSIPTNNNSRYNLPWVSAPSLVRACPSLHQTLSIHFSSSSKALFKDASSPTSVEHSEAVQSHTISTHATTTSDEPPLLQFTTSDLQHRARDYSISHDLKKKKKKKINPQSSSRFSRRKAGKFSNEKHFQPLVIINAIY